VAQAPFLACSHKTALRVRAVTMPRWRYAAIPVEIARDGASKLPAAGGQGGAASSAQAQL
jgi:hypothetical protein